MRRAQRRSGFAAALLQRGKSTGFFGYRTFTGLRITWVEAQ
jgi:hypothetical protein